MIVTPDDSMRLYREMADNPPKAPIVQMRQFHCDPYKKNGKNVVSIVHTDDRAEGIRKAIELIGGISPMINGVKGNILIKPNCNTDDPYPRDTHFNTIKTISQILIDSGIKPDKIIVGDMSGRARGLPTRATMENLGITEIAEDLGVNTSYFDEEDWVTVRPSKSKWWPIGIKIPKTVYNSERIIFTPILRSHSTATFTCSLKLGVGLIDAYMRDWLHNGENFYEKMMDINLAYQVDMVIADAMKINTGYGTYPVDEVTPAIITASNNMVASDAVSAALMKHYKTVRVASKATQKHLQFQIAQSLGLGGASLAEIELLSCDLNPIEEFKEILRFMKSEFR